MAYAEGVQVYRVVEDTFQQEAIMEVRARTTFGIKGLVAVAFAACLAGCSFYHHRFDVASEPRVPSKPKDPPELHIMQADDFGTLWDVESAQKALNSINRQWPKTNVLVMVFIHGWHHNAAQNDGDLDSFKEALKGVKDRFDEEHRSEVRKALTGDEKFTVIGVYIGWRGRSLPGYLDFATASWRKSAAQRVGSGDVYEFLQRLQNMYRKANGPDRKAKDDQDEPTGKHGQRRAPIMGLVTIGHSFGAQVLLQSVSRSLEYALIQRAPCIADLLGSDDRSAATQKKIDEACKDAQKERDEANKGRSEEPRPIESLGDLCILLNPAAEAYQFQRIDALYKQLSYANKQTPQLVVFSADNDWARATLFPIQRATTLAFRPMFRGPNQGSLWGTAVGELEGQQTHELNPGDGDDTLKDDHYQEDSGKKIREHDFTGTTRFNKIVLTRNDQRVIDNSPVAVVYTKQDIIHGHSGIFKPEFLKFLATYIAFAEGKRFLWRVREREQEALLP